MRIDVTRTVAWIGWLVAFSCAASAVGQPQVLFYDSFEDAPAGAGMTNWVGWMDLSWSGSAPMCVNKPANCFGPHMLDQSTDVATDGLKSAKATRSQPAWYAATREEPALAAAQDQIIRLSGNQFEIFFKTEPFPPDNWEFNDHDQVHGWIALMNEDESEFFALGVHAHKWSAPPMLDRWTYMSWATSLDDWNVTDVHRAQSEWRHLEIVVRPYSGQVGDVAFYIDGELVGEGRRQPGPDCRGVPVTRIAMGANPTHIPVDYIANSYETYYYDEIELSLEPAPPSCPNSELRFDNDNDGDVDQEDFAAFQRCHTGTGDPGGAFDCACFCLDIDTDKDIDTLDYAAFEACASGPDIPADESCDDGWPIP